VACYFSPVIVFILKNCHFFLEATQSDDFAI